MFSKNSRSGGKPRAPGLSFIGSELAVSGDLDTPAQLHIDGRVNGNVRCDTLCQGEGGTISGNIVAGQARVAGLVDGMVTARVLVLEASARVTGDVLYETITIAAGARIEGRLTRSEGSEKQELLTATPTGPAKPMRRSAQPAELFPPAAAA